MTKSPLADEPPQKQELCKEMTPERAVEHANKVIKVFWIDVFCIKINYFY